MSQEKTPAIETALYGGKINIKFFPDSHSYWIDGKRKTGVTTLIGIKDKSTALVSWATELCADHLISILDSGKKISEADVLEAQVLHTKKKEEASDIGTKIHDWCEHYIKAKLKEKGYSIPDMPEETSVQIGINAFLDWEKEHNVKFISSERIVYSKKYDYLGKMDIEAKVDGKVCLVDLKSSSGLYNTVRLQTSAYARADEEERKKKVYEGRWAIRLAKETEEEYDARMEKKNAKRIKNGKEPVDYGEYKVFEAMYLDDTKGMIEDDFEAFLSAMTLHRWDKRTDFFYNKK